MTIEKINEAFNEALEEISIEENEQYSMDFVQHHENELETKLGKLKKISGIQYGIFLILFLLVIFNDTIKFIHISYTYAKYLPVLLWGIIMINSYFATKRAKKIKELENKLLLIGVYKKLF